MLELAEVADICWVWIPVLSLSIMRMSPGFILPFSSSSSPLISSTWVGRFRMVRLLRVEDMMTSPISSPAFSSKTVNVSLFRGKVRISVCFL